MLAQWWGSVTAAASLISILVVERDQSVGDGLAAEIEANRLFLAGVDRSLFDGARRKKLLLSKFRLSGFASRPVVPADAEALDEETMRS